MSIRIVEAKSASTRQAVYEFRYRVYGAELGKKLPGIDHDAQTYRDALDKDAVVLVAVDQESGEIVGTLRNNKVGSPSFPQSLRDRLQLESLLGRMEARSLAYSSAFMVDPTYRGKTVASLLFLAMARRTVDAGRQVELCVAEPALVSLYQRLGFCTYIPSFRSSSEAGLRTPMALAIQDWERLVAIESPLCHALTPKDNDGGAATRVLTDVYPEYRTPVLSPMEQRALWAALATGGAPTDVSLFEGLEGDEVPGFLASYPRIKLGRGERLYRQGEKERGMALVLKGRLGITLEEGESPHYIAVLGAGELCGELASLVGSGRTATTQAIEETELLLLPENLVDKVARDNPADALRICRNLSSMLARRLAATNGLVAQAHGQSPEGRRPVRDQTATRVEGLGAQQSYAITTLGDPETELARLESQAHEGWTFELPWLRRAGFRDHSVFLDLGSGPGVTSFLLARTFPRSRIVGIEPEEMLLQRAQTRAREQGLDERCRFLAGSGQQLPLEDDSVDFAYVRFVVQHIPDPMPIFRELRRVVRPGGIVLVADVDDEGVVVHPEPANLRDFQTRAAAAQQQMGGDRAVGRKLMAYLQEAGFVDVRIDVAPITSQDLSFSLLTEIAFSFKEQLLRRSGMWQDSDAVLLEELGRLAGERAAWLLIPVFFCHGVA